MSAPDGMSVVAEISDWLRDLRRFQARRDWTKDRAGLLELTERKAELFARMAEVAPRSIEYAEAARKAQTQVEELRAELQQTASELAASPADTRGGS